MDHQPQGTEKTYTIEAVDCAIDVLLVVAGEPDLGGSEIARRMGGSKQRIFRMLRTLEARGLLSRDESGKRYRLGYTALVLGAAARTQTDLIRLAEPIMREIGKQIDDTVQLRVRDELNVLCVAKWEPPRDLRVNVVIGRRRPLHAGAGRIMLAFLPKEVQEQVIAQGLERFTPNTITDPAALREKLEEVRQQGFGVSRGEINEALASVTVPVFGIDRTIVATLTASSSADRIRDGDYKETLALLQAGAARLSKALGYVPPSGG